MTDLSRSVNVTNVRGVPGRPDNSIDVHISDDIGIVTAIWGEKVSGYELSADQANLLMDVLQNNKKNLMEYIPANTLIDMVVALNTDEISQDQFDKTLDDLTKNTAPIRGFEKLQGLRGDTNVTPVQQIVLQKVTQGISNVPDVVSPTILKP